MTKIDIHRMCPACRVWGYHPVAPLAHTANVAWKAMCRNCGHVWPCRISAGDRLANAVRATDEVIPIRGPAEGRAE